ncbi:sensor histidine kinase [Paracnuella aquatica]|uniref:sensor histidine kinase n=1 Tax=Paracnuella aquatica TaxID=2268757 RepID=UPI000DEF60A8|nr:ATP-binding protein [Paracnuella aquatica]RPD50714.1 PAS domain S-box protein [Paracnuella aquatica]
MNDVLDFFSKLLDTSDWPPRWHCGKWTEFHGWLYIISDLLIWSAYFAIPLIILKFITRKAKARFIRAYFLFAAFILACGSTHLLDAITFWFPAYRLNALVRFITGAVSWATVFYMIKIMPEAMTLKTNEELEHEVAEREKAEQELRIANQQLLVAQDIANLGHWHWDMARDQVIWSAKLYQIFGLPIGTPINYKQYLQHIHPADRQRVNKSVEEALAKKQYAGMYHRILLEDGTEKILFSKGEVLVDADGNLTGLLGTAQDVTEQQKAQQELVEKTYALEATNQELQRFAYVASHDLKEPLRKILTFASLLQQQGKDHLDEREQGYVGKIVQSTARMQTLIEDILQFSSIREQAKGFVRVNMMELLQQVLIDMEVLIGQTGARISWNELPQVEAIPSQIGQLLQNLLTNAIKFAKPGMPPRIVIEGRLLTAQQLNRERLFPAFTQSLLDGNNEQARQPLFLLKVEDDGIGFDPAYTGKAFEIFQRLHGAQYGGTGIGLAICKRIAENHHGAITALSQPGKGAEFFLVMPVLQQGVQAL